MSRERDQRIEQLVTDLQEIEARHLHADHVYEIEAATIKNSISDFIHKRTRPGFGSPLARAREVLEIGVRHIAEGRPTDEFLQFVAVSIHKTLQGEAKSLDHAFGLKQENGRPPEDPYDDPAVLAYLAEMREYQAATSNDAMSPSEQKKELKSATKRALDRAYFARNPSEEFSQGAAGIDDENIRDRKKTIIRTLRKLGHC